MENAIISISREEFVVKLNVLQKQRKDVTFFQIRQNLIFVS